MPELRLNHLYRLATGGGLAATALGIDQLANAVAALTNDLGRAADGSGHPATVDIEEPMGADTLIWTKLAGQILSARTTDEFVFRPGQPVTLTLDMTRASLFDKQSQERL